MHDAEYTEEEYKRTKTWGHTTYKDALNLALEAKVKSFGLWHHNQDRTDDAIDGIVEECKGIIERSHSDLECFAAAEGMEIKL